MSDERNAMSSFWKEHSKDATIEEMFLDSSGQEIAKIEQPEILHMLPDYKGKRILELGAGIGRHTGEIAEKALHVTAVDFMENFVQKNKQANGKHQNVEFLCADVTQLERDPESYDIIFSNWLLMYLGDKEVHQLLNKMLTWLTEGGQLFFHESCFGQSGDKERTTNPTNYRSPMMYGAFLDAAHTVTQDGGVACFELVWARSLQAYIQMKSNPNQLCWLYKKVVKPAIANGDTEGHPSFQQFLDKQQYSVNGILRYERVFGKDFVSTGGLKTTEEFVPLLKLKPGEKVIDVGAGIGGSAFYMAKAFDVEVLGIDLSANMISLAQEKTLEYDHLCHKVQFEICDVTTREFSPETFDVVYTRDTLLHIADKPALFKKFLMWLKPGGRLMITDYCCGTDPWTDEFTKYVHQRGYHLMDVQTYGKV
jgi:phosphoethanolamine N-methyltransferase